MINILSLKPSGYSVFNNFIKNNFENKVLVFIRLNIQQTDTNNSLQSTSPYKAEILTNIHNHNSFEISFRLNCQHTYKTKTVPNKVLVHIIMNYQHRDITKTVSNIVMVHIRLSYQHTCTTKTVYKQSTGLHKAELPPNRHNQNSFILNKNTCA